MYKVDHTDYGIKLTFSGQIKHAEMRMWLDEFMAVVDQQQGNNFHVFVDMRTLQPLPSESQEAMHKGQRYARTNGMHRSVVILNSVATTMQFKRIALATGIYDYERYINADAVPDWEQVALAWLLEGVDPD